MLFENWVTVYIVEVADENEKRNRYLGLMTFRTIVLIVWAGIYE